MGSGGGGGGRGGDTGVSRQNRLFRDRTWAQLRSINQTVYRLARAQVQEINTLIDQGRRAGWSEGQIADIIIEGSS